MEKQQVIEIKVFRKWPFTSQLDTTPPPLLFKCSQSCCSSLLQNPRSRDKKSLKQSADTQLLKMHKFLRITLESKTFFAMWEYMQLRIGRQNWNIKKPAEKEIFCIKSVHHYLFLSSCTPNYLYLVSLVPSLHVTFSTSSVKAASLVPEKIRT